MTFDPTANPFAGIGHTIASSPAVVPAEGGGAPPVKKPIEVIAKDIVQDYPSGNGVNRVIDGITLEFNGPGIHMLLGPSGCGKSTLLRMLGGVRPPKVRTPTSGTVTIDGVLCESQLDDAITVFQAYANRPDLNVRQNVEFPFRLSLWKKRVKSDEVKVRVDEMIEAVGLTDKQKLYPAQLSGGQNQRVALARALALKPRILLMDEPFGALDAQTRQGMQNLLVKLYNQQPCLIVFVTHDVSEALILGDRVIMLSTGPAKVVDTFLIAAPRGRTDEWLRGSEALSMQTRVLSTLGRRG